jgi:hypothetical protein
MGHHTEKSKRTQAAGRHGLSWLVGWLGDDGGPTPTRGKERTTTTSVVVRWHQWRRRPTSNHHPTEIDLSHGSPVKHKCSPRIIIVVCIVAASTRSYHFHILPSSTIRTCLQHPHYVAHARRSNSGYKGARSRASSSLDSPLAITHPSSGYYILWWWWR